MANYAFGDIQGCFDEFEAALEKIKFNPKEDYLWLAGDLINRGPDSLKLLKYIHKTKDRIHVVLGNHDLHFLSCFYSGRKSSKTDTLEKLFESRDCEVYANYLLEQPLIFVKKIKTEIGLKKVAMIHAGIPSNLSIKKCLNLNNKFQKFIMKNPKKNLNKLFSKCPKKYEESLTSAEKKIFFANALTRLRIGKKNGEIDFSFKGGIESVPKEYEAWFKFYSKSLSKDVQIIFGHWAALNGHTKLTNIIGLDSGCVWGGKLRIMRLEDNKKYYIKKIKK